MKDILFFSSFENRSIWEENLSSYFFYPFKHQEFCRGEDLDKRILYSKILFLDESTVSLNLKIKETLINNLVQESKNGLTIIINSHEEVLKKYAENIIELNRENSNL